MNRDGKNLQWKHIFLITAVTLFTYSNSLPNGFVGDDLPFITHNPGIKSLGNIPSAFTGPGAMGGESAGWGNIIFRPLRTASYALDYSLFGLWAPGFHAVNLALHVFSSVLVYLLARSLLVLPLGSLLAGLLFALHPAHVEAVSWISSRADLIGFVFFALSLLLYISYRQHSRSTAYLALSTGSFFLACLGKETMVSFPVLIILYDVAFRRNGRWRDFIRSHAPVWALFAGVCGVYLFYRYGVTGRMTTEKGWWGGSFYSNSLMMAKVSALYIGLLLFPLKLKSHHIFKESQTVFSPDILLSILVVGAGLALTLYFYRKNRTVFFLFAWFFAGLVPVSNIIPISFAPMSERYLYMPSAGPLMAAGAGLAFLFRKLRESGREIHARTLSAVLVLLLLAFSIRILVRNGVYRDSFAFYSTAAADSPGSAPSHKGLGDFFLEKGDYDQAIRHYQKAKSIDPAYAGALIGEASAFQKINRNDLAITGAEAALSFQPGDPLIRFSAGNIFQAGGDLERARFEWERAAELNPNFSEAYNQLGAYYHIQKDYVLADDMYRKALKANPENAETHYNLATIYEMLNERDRAEEHYRRFIELADGAYPGVAEDIQKRFPRLKAIQ